MRNFFKYITIGLIIAIQGTAFCAEEPIEQTVATIAESIKKEIKEVNETRKSLLHLLNEYQRMGKITPAMKRQIQKLPESIQKQVPDFFKTKGLIHFPRLTDRFSRLPPALELPVIEYILQTSVKNPVWADPEKKILMATLQDIPALPSENGELFEILEKLINSYKRDLEKQRTIVQKVFNHEGVFNQYPLLFTVLSVLEKKPDTDLSPFFTFATEEQIYEALYATLLGAADSSLTNNPSFIGTLASNLPETRIRELITLVQKWIAEEKIDFPGERILYPIEIPALKKALATLEKELRGVQERGNPVLYAVTGIDNTIKEYTSLKTTIENIARLQLEQKPTKQLLATLPKEIQPGVPDLIKGKTKLHLPPDLLERYNLTPEQKQEALRQLLARQEKNILWADPEHTLPIQSKNELKNIPLLGFMLHLFNTETDRALKKTIGELLFTHEAVFAPNPLLASLALAGEGQQSNVQSLLAFASDQNKRDAVYKLLFMAVTDTQRDPQEILGAVQRLLPSLSTAQLGILITQLQTWKENNSTQEKVNDKLITITPLNEDAVDLGIIILFQALLGRIEKQATDSNFMKLLDRFNTETDPARKATVAKILFNYEKGKFLLLARLALQGQSERMVPLIEFASDQEKFDAVYALLLHAALRDTKNRERSIAGIKLLIPRLSGEQVNRLKSELELWETFDATSQLKILNKEFIKELSALFTL